MGCCSSSEDVVHDRAAAVGLSDTPVYKGHTSRADKERRSNFEAKMKSHYRGMKVRVQPEVRCVPRLA